MKTHPILVTLTVGQPFWTVSSDTRSIERAIRAGKEIMCYSVRPTCLPWEGVPVRVNETQWGALTLFPAIPVWEQPQQPETIRPIGAAYHDRAAEGGR